MSPSTTIPKWRSLPKLPVARVASINIANGAHKDRTNGLCVMEVAAWVAGEPHSDHPRCVSAVIGAFMRQWNDALPDKDRTRLLRPLLKVVLNTRSTADVEKQRALMCDDWIIRTFTPTWLELAGISEQAAALRALPEITDLEGLRAAAPTLEAARKASAAARAAAWDAARDAARAAAWAVSRRRFAPTVKVLQKSAQDLVRRMAAVKETQA